MSNEHPQPAPSSSIYLKNGNIVCVATGTVTAHDLVLGSDGLINALLPPSSPPDPFLPCTIHDLHGLYLTPGLIDCHVHLSVVPGPWSPASLSTLTTPQSLLRQPSLCAHILGRGFTTVRDCGGATAALSDALAGGAFPGPRLLRAGRALSQTGGHGDFRGVHDQATQCCGSGAVSANLLGRVCDGVAACQAAAPDELRQGADFLKIMAGGGVVSPTDRLLASQFSVPEIAAVVDVARLHGTYVTAHAYTPQSVRRCVENGVRGIEHGNLIDGDTAALMAREGAFLTPTLVTYKMLAELKEGEIAPEVRAKNQEVLRAGLRSLTIADEAGVTICHGSDLLGNLWAAQTREFAIRAEALEPLKVLQGATVNAARLLMMEDKLGQVKEGFFADLLVMAKNPLDDVKCLDDPQRNLRAIFRGGRCVWSRAIEGLHGEHSGEVLGL